MAVGVWAAKGRWIKRRRRNWMKGNGDWTRRTEGKKRIIYGKMEGKRRKEQERG